MKETLTRIMTATSNYRDHQLANKHRIAQELEKILLSIIFQQKLHKKNRYAMFSKNCQLLHNKLSTFESLIVNLRKK